MIQITFEIKRFLFLIIPYVFFSTLAAFILFDEHRSMNRTKFITYVLIASISQTLTYQISDEFIRFVVEIITGFVIFLLTFRSELRWAFKIYATSYVFGIINSLLAVCFFVGFFFNSKLGIIKTDANTWLLSPLFSLQVIVAWILRKRILTAGSEFTRLAAIISNNIGLVVAFALQAFIICGLASEILLMMPRDEHFFLNIMLGIGIFVLFGLSIYVIIKSLQASQKEIIISTQDAVSENIMNLVNSIKGQKHDFLNHLQIIGWLVEQKDVDSLQHYTSRLLKEVSQYNEVLKVGNPIIGALLNAKISQANGRGINTQVDIHTTFQGFEYRSMEIARILANLIDNALDAVEVEGISKEVNLEIYEQGPVLICDVCNECNSSFNPEKAFDYGFTSKGEGHSGIGLYISLELAKKINGHLKCSFPSPSVACFTLIVPKP